MRARLHPDPPPHRRLVPVAQFGVILSLLTVVLVFGHFPIVTGLPAAPRLLRRRESLTGLAAAAASATMPAELSAAPLPMTIVSSPAVSEPLAASSNQTNSTVEAMQLTERQSASAAPNATAVPQPQQRLPIFYEYKVQPGDTLSGIASRFNIGANYIVWNNSEVTNRDTVPVGITLQIPSVEGIIHSVRLGETVSSIAAKYGAAPQDIVEFAANGLQNDPNRLQPNELIMVPGGKILPPKPVPADTVPSTTSVSADGWGWPAVGPLTSTFGPWHPLGIDIAIPSGTPVRAAHTGTVVFAGGNPCCSYGYHVILDNGNGYETVYGHLSAFRVKLGDHVTRGQLLGLSGSTGHSTGPHLHFEIRRDGVIQNPELFLPVDPWLPAGTAWPPPPKYPEYPPCPGAPLSYGC